MTVGVTQRHGAQKTGEGWVPVPTALNLKRMTSFTMFVHNRIKILGVKMTMYLNGFAPPPLGKIPGCAHVQRLVT